MEEQDFWLAFSVFPGIGPVRFRLLREYFGTAKKHGKQVFLIYEKQDLGKNSLLLLINFVVNSLLMGIRKITRSACHSLDP